MDELIAWTEIKLPEAVLQGETHEDWYPLSGKQGDGMEGMIDLVLSFTVCFFLLSPRQHRAMLKNLYIFRMLHNNLICIRRCHPL